MFKKSPDGHEKRSTHASGAWHNAENGARGKTKTEKVEWSSLDGTQTILRGSSEWRET